MTLTNRQPEARRWSWARAVLSFQPTPRMWFFFFALIIELIASAISGVGFVLNNQVFFLGGTLIWIVWFAVIFLIALPQTDSFLRNRIAWLKRGALIIFILLFLMGLTEGLTLTYFHSMYTEIPTQPGPVQDLTRNLEAMDHGFRYNDATALCQQAAENLNQLKNPYANSNIITALKESGASYDRVTPLREGLFALQFPYPDNNQLQKVWQDAVANSDQPPVEIESRLTYPAGSFLLTSPFLLAGIQDIRIVYFIFVIAALGYMAWLLRRDGGLFFIAAAMVSLEVWNSIGTGETGTLPFSFLLLGWALALKMPWQSAIFMGIAVATKQTAWFFLPFYLILIYKINGPRRIWPIIGIIAGIFLAANLPFAVFNPRLWFDSVMAPMTDNMFPLGVGFITLLTGGLIDIRSQLLFAGLEVVAELICLLWYWRNAKRYPQSGPILAVLPIFFAWRSLWTYFFYVSLIILASVMFNHSGEAQSSKTEAQAISTRS